MSYVCSKVKAGRPKISSIYDTGEFITKELREKREKFGLKSTQEPMTVLFVLWSRKKITYEQFVAGCYFEELSYKLKRSCGCLQGAGKTSLARLQDGELRVIRNKLPVINMNERCSNMLADVRDMISMVHPSSMSLMERMVIMNDLSLIDVLENTVSMEMKIVQKSLNMIGDQMKKHIALDEDVMNKMRYAV